MTTATGPFVKTAELPAYAEALATLLQQAALEHTRTAAEAALNLLTNPDSAALTLRAVCSMARVDPYVPLLDSLPAAFMGRAAHESVATLVPIPGGWVVVRAVEAVRSAGEPLGYAMEAPVTGPQLQMTFDTGFPHWLSTAELAAAIGVDVATLTSTPADIRAVPGLPAGPATSGLILRLVEDRTFGMLVKDAHRIQDEARQSLWHMVADSFRAAGQEVPGLVTGVQHAPGFLDTALKGFRSANPDPTDLDGAVALAVRLVLEAGQAKLTDDLVQSDRRSHRVRTVRPAKPPKRLMV